MTTSLAEHARARHDALTHALRPSVWRATLSADLARLSVAAPLRVGFAVACTLVIGGMTGHRDVAGLAALGALIAAFCRADPFLVRAGRLAVLAIGIVTSVGVGAVLGLTDAPVAAEIAVISVLAGAAALGVAALHITGPGAIVFVFAANAATGFTDDATDLTRALSATALGTVVGAGASLAPWIWRRHRATAIDSTPVHYHSLWRTLRRRPQPDLLINSGRIVVATAASAAIAVGIGFSHPMWAAMGALAAMQGVSYHLTVQRGVQRLLGNIVGAVVAAALLGMGLGYWGAVIAIVACQVIAEIWAPVNYAVTSLAVTPMALLLIAVSAGLSPQAAIDRVADTLIGVVLGIVVAAMTISVGDHPGRRSAGMSPCARVNLAETTQWAHTDRRSARM
ncbi:MAG: FUSC family protein [Gordonia sp.]|uniref:FUSC family protein n=1 Tax=Gordonia sp. (in: high G+C Gram-positive bacteria) TaxID=84139 RepID=UPI000C539AE7|nr:FUSC family protein [Gordonia sp. (in: high G+C Gram-positive bacteria)]MAU81214.1 FUSC family protein [Gordonia sp. (in: high G+C Gram-positive bacteria)]